MTLVTFTLFIAILALVMGFFLLLAPAALKKINELSARMIARVDNLAFSYRIGLGVSLLIVAAFMFFMAYYFSMKRY